MELRTGFVLAALLLALSACPGAAGTGPDEEGAVVAAEKKTHRNRLADESSPYLRQHGGNPVDWYPWGDEAFRKAKEEDKPVFLSIGYSTCHWCHVMERESFEDEATAAILNEHFVSIKVDREERPDVDAIYMNAVVAMTGQGGWPLSVFLTPDRKPFYGGTYFPPVDRFQRPGFPTLLRALADAWENRRPEVLQNTESLMSHLAGLSAKPEATEVGEDTLATAYRQYAAEFDEARGGFGSAPKFPRSHSLMLLLRWYERTEDRHALEMVTKTLDGMARGGMFDHVGGGFHRYSTDRDWFLPHFEKMLYDQALLARTYVEAYQVTGEERWSAVARDILRYVLRDMTDAAGGFYSAEDADSEGVEGKFYVWSYEEILSVLGEEDGTFLAETYGAKPDGNFVEEASREDTGLNILHLAAPLDATAEARLRPLREKLFAVRERRVHPLLDDKVLTDWNGLMIGTLARAGRALAEPEYVKAAERAADFLLTKCVREDGRLLHRWRAGEAEIPAFLDDYAFLAEGLLDLYQATFDPRWLAESKRLLVEMRARFSDTEGGGFWLTADDAEAHLVRTREVYDGAVPSGNSVAALTLLRVGRLTADTDLQAAGDATIRAFSGAAARAPIGYPYLLMALDFAVGPAKEIVLAGAADDPALAALRRAVDRRFRPRTVVALNPTDGGEAIRALIPFLEGKDPVDGKPAAYVCTNYACQAPVTTLD